MVTPYLYFLIYSLAAFPHGAYPANAHCLCAWALPWIVSGITPGFHTAACVLIAYIRPFLSQSFNSTGRCRNNYEEPSFKSMGGILPYMIFIGVLTFIHHGWLFLLEAWQFGNIWYFLVKTLLSTVLSLFLIIITELLFTRQQKFRTNTRIK